MQNWPKFKMAGAANIIWISKNYCQPSFTKFTMNVKTLLHDTFLLATKSIMTVSAILHFGKLFSLQISYQMLRSCLCGTAEHYFLSYNKIAYHYFAYKTAKIIVKNSLDFESLHVLLFSTSTTANIIMFITWLWIPLPYTKPNISTNTEWKMVPINAVVGMGVWNSSIWTYIA